MRRLTTTALVAFGLVALSCHPGRELSLPVDGASLPAVSAPPPVAHDVRGGVLESGTNRIAPSPAPSFDDPAAAKAYAYLETRHTGLSEEELQSIARLIAFEADRYQLDPDLVVAVIHVESGGYAFAESRVGALGLMQLLPSTGAELAARLHVPWSGPDSLYDPEVNVRLGIAYLRELADRFDDETSTVLAAYNWGPGHISRRIRRGVKLPREYAESVLKKYHDAHAETRRSS